MDCSRARTKDPREWLELCPEFSWPLAEQVHEWILTAEADLIESIKWNMLCFSGRKLVCGLSACQRHLGITFFRGTELPDPSSLLIPAESNTHILSMRVTTLKEFPLDAFRRLLHAAVGLDAEASLTPVPNRQREPWPVPPFFAKALTMKKNRTAAENFRRFPPTYQREYLVWLSQAKLPETREHRLIETLRALTHGKKWALRKSA